MTSKVSYQVMWNRLISIVEEQAQALVRTAFSTSVREAGDLSAGVYNESGEMLAQAVTGDARSRKRYGRLRCTFHTPYSKKEYDGRGYLYY